MSKKTKDSKGMGKMKTANGMAKPSRIMPKPVAKQAAPVVKIAPASARRVTEKPVTKDTKASSPPAAPENPATALPMRKLGLRGAAPCAARHAPKPAAVEPARAAEPPPPHSAQSP